MSSRVDKIERALVDWMRRQSVHVEHELGDYTIDVGAYVPMKSDEPFPLEDQTKFVNAGEINLRKLAEAIASGEIA